MQISQALTEGFRYTEAPKQHAHKKRVVSVIFCSDLLFLNFLIMLIRSVWRKYGVEKCANKYLIVTIQHMSSMVLNF